MVVAETEGAQFRVMVFAAEIFEVKAVAFQVMFFNGPVIYLAQVFHDGPVTADDTIDLLIKRRAPVGIVMFVWGLRYGFFPSLVVESGAADIVAEFAVFAEEAFCIFLVLF